MHRLREGKGGRHLKGHTDSLLKSNFKKLVTHLCTLSTRSSNKISKKSSKSKLEQNSSIVHKSYIFHNSIIDFFYLWYLIIMEKIPKKTMVSRSLTRHLAPPPPPPKKKKQKKKNKKKNKEETS